MDAATIRAGYEPALPLVKRLACLRSAIAAGHSRAAPVAPRPAVGVDRVAHASDGTARGVA